MSLDVMRQLANQIRIEEGKKEKLKEATKVIDSNLKVLKYSLVKELEKANLQKIDIPESGLFLITKAYAVKTTDMPLLKQHLVQAGREELLTVNNNTLKSYIKEFPEGYDFSTMGVEVTPSNQLGSRKAKS